MNSVGGKVTGEIAAIGTIAGAVMEWLPIVAVSLAIVWHILLIYNWIDTRRTKKKDLDKE